MIKNRIDVLVWVVLFNCLILVSTGVNAACPAVLNVRGPSSITYDPSGPDLLWEGSVSVSGGTLVCPANPPGTYPISGYIAYDEHYDGIGTPNGNIYESGIPGIGYRLWLEGSSVAVAGRYWPTIVRGLRWAGSFTINPHTMRVQLIRTGPISQGGLLSGVFGKISAGGMTDVILYTWSPAIVVKPSVPTCVVITPSVRVPLGSVPRAEFAGLNSTSASRPLNIGLSCSGGDGIRGVNVYTTLTDNTNPGNRSTSLTLTSASTAKGVAIQVLKNGAVLGYGPASSANGNTNQWFAGTSSGGILNIPLTARYVQTGPTVTAGSANGVATFTMSYK